MDDNPATDMSDLVELARKYFALAEESRFIEDDKFRLRHIAQSLQFAAGTIPLVTGLNKEVRQ